MHIFKIYQRNFNKNKSIHIISIGGFALSLAIFFLIAAYVVQEKSTDRSYPNVERMYRLTRNENHANLPIKAKERMLESAPEIEKISFYNASDVWFDYGGEKYEALFLKTDKEFFEIFSIDCIEGNLDGMFLNNDNVLITQSYAQEIFGERNPVGEKVKMIGGEFKTIAGMVADLPGKGSLKYEMILNQDNEYFNYRSCFNIDCYAMYNAVALIHPNAIDSLVQDKLSTALQGLDPFKKETLAMQPFGQVYFDVSLNDAHSHANVKFIGLLMVVALAILILSVFNYVNLNIAINLDRFKEICVKKTAGARVKNIVSQFLKESYISCFVATALSILMVFFLSPFFTTLFKLDFEIKEIFKTPILLLLPIALVVLLGGAIGYLPAKLVSSYNPVQLVQRKSKAFKTQWTGMLNVLQFVVTIVLLISLMVINKQTNFVKTKDMGFATEHLVHVQLNGDHVSSSDEIKEKLLSFPSILNVTASQGNPFNIWNIGSGSFNVNGEEVSVKDVSQLTVDGSFLETFKIPLVLGRDFRKTDKNVSIITGSGAQPC
jgi:putative ABC transport system permease protein